MQIAIAAGTTTGHSRTLVTADARMSHYSTGEGELYDLAADRSERTNLFDNPPRSTCVTP